MSEQPITLSVLMRCHRKVFLPDVERIVSRAVGRLEQRLRDEMRTLHDSLLVKFERLETEYVAIKAALGRLEQRLDSLETGHRELAAEVRQLDERLSRIEKRLDEMVDSLVATQQRYALQAEVQNLRTRLDAVETQIAALRKPQS
jgi:chromosome segregation ATPase